MKRKKHILMVIPRMLYSEAGGELRILSLLSRLSSRYRFSILTFLEPSSEKASLAASLFLEKDMVTQVHFVRRTTDGGKESGAWMPKEAAWFSDPAMKRTLDDIVGKQPVDLVHLEFSEMGHYANGISARVPVILTVHDTSFFSLRRSYLRMQDGWRRLMRPWVWARRLAYHWQILRRCDRVVVVSEADRRRLSMLASPKRISVVPTGVDLGKFSMQPQEGREPNRLVYVGHYMHYPNEDAAVFLCKEILPRIQEEIPGARVTLVGSDPPAKVRALASQSVEVTGTVPDVHPYLAKAQVFLAPIRLSYGIKGKLLEAFASGTPVVATPQACEGFPGLSDGEHALLARDAETFSRKTKLLLSEPGLRQNLAAKARSLAERSFGWDQQADRLAQVYDEMGVRRGA